jgi:hypothetical protein
MKHHQFFLLQRSPLLVTAQPSFQHPSLPLLKTETKTYKIQRGNVTAIKPKASTTYKPSSFPMENKSNQQTDRDRDPARDREAMACTSRNRARTRRTRLGGRTRHSTGPSVVLASLSPLKLHAAGYSDYPSLIPPKQEGSRIKIGCVGNIFDRIRTSSASRLRVMHCKRLQKERLGTGGMKIFPTASFIFAFFCFEEILEKAQLGIRIEFVLFQVSSI